MSNIRFSDTVNFLYFDDHHTVNVGIKFTDKLYPKTRFIVDTGAEVSTLNLNSNTLKRIGKFTGESTSYSIGGEKIEYQFIVLNEIKISNTKLSGVVFAHSEKSKFNLLGANVLAYLNPYLGYREGKMYLNPSSDIGVSGIKTYYRCKNLYIQERDYNENYNGKLTPEEESMLQLIQDNSGVLYAQEFDVVTIHSHVPYSLNTCNSLVEKGYLNKNDNKYTLKIRDTEEVL